MKSILLLFISLCITMMLQAQVSKTIEVTAGNLQNAITPYELNTVTNLTLIGTMNRSDFGMISNFMPLLTEIDLTRVDITDNIFSGFAANFWGGNLVYSNNYLKSIKLPLTCTSIYGDAFLNCNALILVEIPSSVRSIGFRSFYGCSSLKSISIPSSVTSIESEAFKGCSALTSIFANSRKPTNLFGDSFYGVDKSKCTLYAADTYYYAVAYGWKDFKNIVEIPFVELSASSIYLRTTSNSATIDIVSYSNWTVSSDQNWVTVNPYISGTDYQTLTISADANPLETNRTALLTFKVDSLICNTLVVNQDGKTKHINVTAGELKSLFSPEELRLLTSLTLSGSIDYSDIETMSYYMPYLAELDLSRVDIVEGPNSWLLANTFSGFTVSREMGNETGNRLFSVKLPVSCTSVEGAFYNCSLLSSVTISSSVKTIGSLAFSYCPGLTSIFVHSSTPPVNLSSSDFDDIFSGIDKYSCTLYVPYGSKDLYASADQWGDFPYIVEIPFVEVFKTQLEIAAAQGSTAATKIVSDVNWTASSDQSWLTLSQSLGTGEQTLTFTADANLVTSPRTATVTVSADGVDSQTITVSQEAGTTALADLAENSTQFKCYPNPFTDEITIEIQNPKRAEISVDIYNLAGERIKNLATQRTDEKLDLKWNGTNEMGYKVAPGVYICKVNKQSKQLILLK